ncbi:hypothetical protein HMPREF2955_14495 [Prevotella sp. HMSC073D09]|nr:hypothetical protein HMPREF2955_14495 [Prevotella sp. HMSC073D09]
MPTSKRKMNRKRWKQPKIIGKRSNDRLGLTIHRLALSHKKAHPMLPSKGGWGGTMINFKTVFITLIGDINYTSRPY